MRQRTTTIEIDLNVRTPNGTFSGLEDCDGLVEPGDVVNVVERASGLFGGGLVTSVDHKRRLVYVSVAWGTLTDPRKTAERIQRIVQHEKG